MFSNKKEVKKREKKKPNKQGYNQRLGVSGINKNVQGSIKVELFM